jgi:hypothetical protein
MRLNRIAYLALIPILLLACLKAGAAEPPLDTTDVTAVVVTGAASSVTLSTEEGRPLQATLDNRRSGWFSHWYSTWFYNDCPAIGSMRVVDATLYVDAPSAGILDRSDCTLELHANLRRETNVSVNQAATEVRLTGDYAAVTVVGQAMDVTLAGHATTITVDGEAVRTHVTFQTLRQNETLDISGTALDAYLDFGRKAQISYTVTAKGSWVDSSLANTPDAKPKVSIKGDFVRATIR